MLVSPVACVAAARWLRFNRAEYTEGADVFVVRHRLQPSFETMVLDITVELWELVRAALGTGSCPAASAG